VGFAQDLIMLLQDYQKKQPRLLAWRFALHQTRGFEVGMKNNKLGGAYTAPSYKRSISGEIYLIWKDQRFTLSKLDSKVLSDFDEYSKIWDSLPEVITDDSEVSAMIESNSNEPFQLLNHGLQQLQAGGIRQVDGGIGLGEDHRVLCNSEGWFKEYLQTPVRFHFEADSSYSESYHEKRWPSQDEIAGLLGRVTEYGVALNQPVDAICDGEMRLILPPAIFEDFSSYFLLTNLSGRLVANGQSRFDIKDFSNQRQVLRPGLHLTIDNLRPLRSFSYPCTAEGVPGGVLDLIASGRLTTPLLDLKYAGKLGLKPTPLSAGGFIFRSDEPLQPQESLLSTTSRALIVCSVLGLHTQDAASGSFSLTADQCLLVEAGKIQGKVSAVISGGFLDALLDESTVFAIVAGLDNPMMAFQAKAFTQ
jgi:PmbA protein